MPISFRELRQRKRRANPEYITNGLLGEGQVLLLAAPAGSFKSVIALNLANGLAKGEDTFGMFKIPNPVKVLYVDAEIGEDYFKQRLDLFYPNPSDAPENLSLVTREHAEIDFKLDFIGRLKPLKQMLNDLKPNVVILDCLNPLLQEEEGERAYSFAADHINRIQREYTDPRPSFIVVHHMRKINPDVDPLDISNIRGHSKLVDWPATRITVRHDRPDKLKLRFLLRHGPALDDLGLVVNLQTLHVTREEGSGNRFTDF